MSKFSLKEFNEPSEKGQITNSELDELPGWWDETDEFSNRCLVMTDEQILERMRSVMQVQFGLAPDSITLDMNFTTDLEADSLDIVEMTLRLEEAFLIPIRDEDAAYLSTVGDVFEYIKYGLKLKVKRVKLRMRIKMQRQRLVRLQQHDPELLEQLRLDFKKLRSLMHIDVRKISNTEN